MKKIQRNSIVDVRVKSTCAYVMVHNENKIERIEPFVYQPMEFAYDDHGYERVYKKGACYKKVRFSPAELGEYRLDFYNEKGEIDDSKVFFSIFSRRQKKLVIKEGEAYTENGQYFLPLGINMAFPESYQDSNGQEFGLSGTISFLGIPQYDKWIRNCAKNGVNLVRIWCGADYFNPDTNLLGELNYAQFTKLDKIFEIANKYNVRLKLTIDKFRYFVDSQERVLHAFDRYAIYKGRAINNLEWIKEETYRKIWLDKLKEYQSRYACNPALFAIEFWNEMNCYGESDVETINDWNCYMADRAREMFPNAILLNSLGSLDCPDALNFYNQFCFEKFDWLQFHSYLDQGAYYQEVKENSIEGIKKIVSLLQNKKRESQKPLYLAETGAVNDHHSGPFRYYLKDDKGMIFVDSVYTPLFAGCFAPGNIWHWDDRYVAVKNLYKYYKPLANVIKDIDFKGEQFESVDLSTSKFYCFVLRGKKNYIAFIRNKSYNWQRILRDCKKPVSLSEDIDFSAVNAENLSVIKIWDEERGSVELDKGILSCKNLKYGILVKGKMK